MTNTKSHTLSLHDALPIYEPLEPFVQSADEQSRQKGQHEHRQVVDGAPGQIKQQRENSVLDEVEVFDDVSVGIRSEERSSRERVVISGGGEKLEKEKI